MTAETRPVRVRWQAMLRHPVVAREEQLKPRSSTRRRTRAGRSRAACWMSNRRRRPSGRRPSRGSGVDAVPTVASMTLARPDALGGQPVGHSQYSGRPSAPRAPGRPSSTGRHHIRGPQPHRPPDRTFLRSRRLHRRSHALSQTRSLPCHVFGRASTRSMRSALPIYLGSIWARSAAPRGASPVTRWTVICGGNISSVSTTRSRTHPSRKSEPSPSPTVSPSAYISSGGAGGF